ncbi:hypothetical protein IMSHALPRED_009472 [Imshaugia aleurites]|uniref:Uncharacterized protein n=1 Tax=Imshaugia aleurites TaxID=172621 RepID=A0A8H3IYX7_9LECA|nr:hypothetical protein IMSHALPRED_009472 [Imshaugia aleurites]
MPRPQPNGRSGKAKARAVTQPSLRFLTLALELRENIYAHVLHNHPSSLVDLLLVNRQLSREVKPFLYKLPWTFDGQSQLFEWLSKVDHAYLRHVEEIRFKLHDINPDEIVGALGKKLQNANITRASGSRGPDTPDNPYFEACRADLRRIGAAFRLLQNLRRLTILSASERDSQPHHRTQDAFSKLVGQCFPKLKFLASEEDQLPIDFISGKSELRTLRFPATTSSEDEETEEIFSALSLTELEICRFPHHTASGSEEWDCVTPVLESASALRSLTLFERPGAETPNLAAEVFVGSQSALKRHRHSLRSLKLLAKPGPEYTADEGGDPVRPEAYCAAFLAQSSLTHVEFLDVWMSIYEHLPRTTQTVTWRLDEPPRPPNVATSVARIKKMVTHAAQMRGSPRDPRHPLLRRIVIHLDAFFPSDEIRRPDHPSNEILLMARAKLGQLGIRLDWKGWEGVPSL